MSLNDKEKERYRRQLGVRSWDQDRLRSASVLVAGVGGLGGTSSLYLALAGVGRLRIADRDRVDPSNLNRQVLFGEESVGRLKAEEAGRRLREANPRIQVEAFAEDITPASVGRLAGGCSLIVDGLDNIATRRVLNAYSVRSRIPYLYGAVRGWEGMLGLFEPPGTACLECLLAGNKDTDTELPVFGSLAGTIGLLQATESLKHLLGLERTLLGRLLIYDGRDMTFDLVDVARNPSCPVCSSLKA